MISNYLVSLIRTYVPLGVGYGVSMLLSLGITVTDDQRLAIVSAAGTVIAGLYYALVRLLEAHFPWAGILLGKAIAPSYTAPAPAVPVQPQSPIDPATPEDSK